MAPTDKKRAMALQPPFDVHTTAAPGAHQSPAVLALAVAGLYAAAAMPAFLVMPPLPGADVVAGAGLAAVLIALSVIDLRQWRLPDALTLPLVLAGILCAAVLGWDTPEARAAAAAAGFLVFALIGWAYRRVRGFDGLGLGDAKLLAASGAWTGLAGLPSVVLAACGLAGLSVLIMYLRGESVGRQTGVPFGPFLAAGTWLVWLYGPLT